jgi:hypothetical protein
MADIILPTFLRTARIRFRYIDTTGISRSPFIGQALTSSLGGDRWGASLEFTPTATTSADSTIERAVLTAFLTRLRGKQNRPYFTDASNRLRGSFPTSELLANPTFASGTTGWTPSSGNIALYSADRILRSTRVAVSADETISSAAITTVNGATYAARVFAYAGSGAMDYRLRMGTSAGGSEVAASAADYTSQGLQTLVGTAVSTTTYFSILDGITSRSASHFMDFAHCSLSRCALVNGASQTGSALNVDQLPVSTNGLLLMGDQFEVITSRGSELKRVTAPLNSNSSGQGYLMFEPPLRGSPADNAAVIIHQPMMRGIFVGEFPEWINEPGIITTASAEFEEAA